MNNKKNQAVYFFSRLFLYLFEASFATFIIFFWLEYSKVGLVTNYFNFNLLLISTLIFGIMIVLMPNFPANKKKRRLLLFLVSVLSAIFIYQILPGDYRIYNWLPLVCGVSIWVGLTLLNDYD